ncbi:hypothetical protein KUCAC02_006975, partial [Chaenocephalus aceratus]
SLAFPGLSSAVYHRVQMELRAQPQSGGISVGHVCRPLYICVYVSTFGGPRETRQYSEPYRLWQPRFRENLCLEVPSSLIFNLHFPPSLSPLTCSPETDGRKLQWQLCLFKSTLTQYPPVTNMTKSLIGVA